MRYTHSVFFIRLSALFFLLACLALPSQVFAAWSRPANLNTFTLLGLPTNNASVAINANGNGIAVWIDENTGKVVYALQNAGVWTASKVLYAPSVNNLETTDSAHVVMQADGTAIAVFSSTMPGPLQYCASGLRVVRCYGPNKSFAKAATLVPGATVWTKLNISAQGISVKDTQLKLDQYGNATASWTYLEKAGALSALQVASKAPTLAWSMPVTVHSSANGLSNPSLTVGVAGHALLAWQEASADLVGGTIYKIRSVYSDNALTGSWNVPEEVASLPSFSWTLHAAMDGVGNPALVWDDVYNISWSRRSCATTCAWAGQALFSAPADHSMTAFSPDIAVDSQGDFLLAWGKTAATGNTIEAQLHKADGSLMTASWLGTSNPKVSMSADGSIGLVGWIDDNSYNAHLVSFTATPSLPVIWSQQPEVVLGAALWGSQIALGTGAANHASAVWLNNTAKQFVYKYVGSTLQ